MKKRMRILSLLICLALLMSATPADLILAAARAEELAEDIAPEPAPAPVPEEASEPAAPAEPEPAGEATQEAEDAPEDGEAPAPEEAPAPAEAEAPSVDYAAAASESPAFALGYAEVLRDDVPVYELPDPQAQAALTLGRGVVYVIARTEEGRTPDRLLAAFNQGGEAGIREGWLDADCLRPMEPEAEVPAYREFCAPLDNVLYYKNLAELPLARISHAVPEGADVAVPSAGDVPGEEASAPAQEAGHPIVMPEVEEATAPEAGHPIVMPEVEETTAPEEGHPIFMPEPTQEAEAAPVEAEPTTDAEPQAPEISTMPLPLDEPLFSVDEVAPGIAQEELELYSGASAALELALPEGVDTMLTSSNVQVATVSESGEVTAVGPGEAVITLAAGDETDSCEVRVIAAPKLTVRANELALGAGEVYDLLGQGFVSCTGSNVKLSFTAQGDCVSVTQSGVLRALSVGEATISVEEVNSYARESFRVVVRPGADSVTIRDRLSLSEGMTADLGITFPEGTYASFRLTSDSPLIVPNEADGTVTALALPEGVHSATGTVTIRTGNGLTDTCAITVQRAPARIELATDSITLTTSETDRRIEATAYDVEGEVVACELVYEVSEPRIVTVANGVIKPMPNLPGDTTVIVRAKGAPGVSASCAVHVLSNARRVTLRRSSITLGVGDSFQLSDGPDGIVVVPANERASSYKYSSSSASCAAVDANGLITAKKKGTAKISIAPEGGEAVALTVTVKPAATSVAFSESSLELGTGATGRLSVSFPSGAAADYVVTSSDPRGDVLSFARDGATDDWILTAKRIFTPATVTLTVTSTLKGYADSCAVTVLPGPRSADEIALTASKDVLGVGETGGSVSATIAPGARAAGGFSYTSSNPTALAVAEDGTLTAKAASRTPVTITATAKAPYAEGQFASASVQITVVSSPARFAINAGKGTLELGVGDSYSLLDDPDDILDIYPEDARVSYSCAASSKSDKSASTSVITVDADGRITAEKAGTAYVRITPRSGADTSVKSLKVVVTKATSALSLSENSLRLGVGMSASLKVSLTSKTYSRYAVSVEGEQAEDGQQGGVIALTQSGEEFTIRCLKPGRATVAVRSEAKGYEDSCAITVLDAPTDSELDATFSVPETIGVGEEGQRASVRCPEDRYAELSFRSSEPDVLSVNAATGELTARRTGGASISVLRNGAVACSRPVRVVAQPTAMELTQAEITLDVGRRYQIDPDALVRLTSPLSCRASYSYAASSKDGKIASTSVITVSADGLITAKKAGTAYVRILTQNEKCSAYLKVTVVKAGSSFAVAPDSVTLGVGMRSKLSVANAPAGAVSYDYNSEIVRVDADGTVTALREGVTQVSARAGSASSAPALVTVLRAPEAWEITFSEDSTARISTNQRGAQLRAQIPEDAMAELRYRIEGEAPAGVTLNESSGALTYTGSARQGSFSVVAYDVNAPEVASAPFTVQIVPSAALRALEPSSIEMSVGGTLRLRDGAGGIIRLSGDDPAATASYSFATYSDKSCKNQSSAVVSATADGVLTAKKTGTAYVKVSCYSGGSAVLTVKVTKLPASAAVSPAILTLGVGMTAALKSSYPSGYSYESSDAQIAAVDAAGTVRAAAQGSATITMTTWDGKADTCLVRVLPEPSTVRMLPEGEMTVCMKQTGAAVSAQPGEEGTMAAFVYRSDRPSVVAVDELTGALHPVAPGTATVTAEVQGNPSVKGQVQVTVKAAPGALVLHTKELQLGVGDSYQIEGYDAATGIGDIEATGTDVWAGYSYYASTKSDKNVKSDVAAVDADGLITAKKAGTAYVRISDQAGHVQSMKVVVTKLATSVSLSEAELSLGVGMKRALAVKFPSKTYARYSIAVSDERVVSLAPDSKAEQYQLTALAAGEATVTVRTESGRVDTCHVTVAPCTSEIHVSFTPGAGSRVQRSASGAYVIGVGEQGAQITATPDAGTRAEFSFTSSSAGTLKVSDTGALTAVAAGSANVTVRVANSAEVASVVIPIQVVGKPASGDLTLAQTTLKLGVGDTYRIDEYDAEENPGGILVLKSGSSASYSFKSSSTAVATVSADGLITAKKAGSTSIRITTQNSKVYKDLKITVGKYPTSLRIEPSLTLGSGMTASLTPSFSTGASAMVEFESSDPSAVRVDARTGALWAAVVEVPRHATITARLCLTGETDTCSVRVLPAPDHIAIDYAALGDAIFYDASGEPWLRVGVNEKGVTVPAVCVDPDTMSDFTYALASGAASGLAVNADTGALTPKTAGEYAVRVTSVNNPSAKVELKVKVVAAPTKVSFASTALKLGVGDVYQIEERWTDAATGAQGGIIELTPADASASYSFSASKYNNKTATTDVLSISPDGLITAKKAGTAYVKVTTQNSKSAVLTVTVVKRPESIGLTPEEMKIGELSRGKLDVSYPEGSYSMIAGFSSSDPDLLQVNADGVVTTGRLPGGAARDVIVTVTTQSGMNASTAVRVLPHPTQVSFAQSVYEVSEGMTLPTGALRFPAGTMAQRVRYSIDNAQVATVDPNSGEITGVNAGVGDGTATVTAVVNPGEGEGYEVTAVALVRVIPAPARISYEGLNLPAKLQIALNDTVELPEPLAYSTSGDLVPAEYTFSLATASDKSYVTLSGNKITGKKVGKDVKINVQSQNGQKTTLTVRVYNNKASKVELFWGEQNVTGGSIDMYVNAAHPTDSVELRGAITGTNLNYGSLSFKSDNEAVATVDERGVVTARASGRAVITASAKSGVSASCTVEVGLRCTSVTLVEDSFLISQGETAQISFSFSPQSSGMRMKYESDDPQIATVSEKGLITAVSGGSTHIQVEAQDGEILATVSVTSLFNPDGVRLPVPKLYMAPGDSVTLTPTLVKSGAQPREINVWTSARSDSTGVASVRAASAANQLGGVPASYTVTAGRAGQATVTVETYGGQTAECVVVVDGDYALEDASGFGWEDGRRLAIVQGDSAQLELGLSTAAFKGEASYAVECDGEALRLSEDMRTITAEHLGPATLTLRVGGAAVDSVEVEVISPVRPKLWMGEGLQESVGDSAQLNVATYNAPGAKHAICVDPLPSLDDSYLLLGRYEVAFDDPELLVFERQMYDSALDKSYDAIRSTERIGRTTARIRTYGSELAVEIEVLAGSVYRALLISEYNGSMSNNLPFTQTNIDLMNTVLKASDIGGQKYKITTLKNPRKSSIKSSIASTFAGAKENDVNLIYIVSHGHMGTGSYAGQYCFSLSKYSSKDANTYVSDTDLMGWLKLLTGKTVLILDSCNSGAFITHQKRVGGLSSGGSIAVITAQVGDKSASYHVKGGGATEATHEFFTRALCRGMGYDQIDKWGALAADTEGSARGGDGLVSVSEAYAYARPLTSQWALACARDHFYAGKSYGFKAPSVSTEAKRDAWVSSDGGETPQAFIPTGMADLPIFGKQP